AGGARAESRGILETKRAVKELRDRITTERETLAMLAQETTDLEGRIVQISSAIAVLDGERHAHEKGIAVHNAQLQHITDEQTRLAQKAEQLVRERRQAEEERDGIDRRQDEARSSITRLQDDQRLADERLTLAQRRLFEVREAVDEWSRRAAEAKAHHAALVERAGALASEAQRLDETAKELEQRASALGIELEHGRGRVGELQTNIGDGERELNLRIGELDALARAVMSADDEVTALRLRTEEHEGVLKQARGGLEAARAVVSELEVASARTEADLSHLAHTCEDAVHASIEEVAIEVERLEQEGKTTPDAAVICAEDPEDIGEDVHVVEPIEGGESVVAAETAIVVAERRTLSAEEAIGALRDKIDRLGPVNMMAIEQFDDLEERHRFLSSERKDLVEAIAQTTEAIVRIDETTRQRFSEAFSAINRYFQETFSALFGGGRAGLTLLDENDPLETGIEIIAQPPGKRLQSVQLLSGGEKALTAIALMFGMFKYKPSPFCLLDEIDAPLDDANIARFVEMLRGMQMHTQFIVITHNRKTMEIADRLYGVTMEEPGVSKLISVQLN
ncbi:MAG TPA: hypothetical protein VNZ26_15675, partial [Vicinamibacterales bacterium]|nr:hypothetical protein [Vicinamibacterales bacterium]